MFPLQSWNRKTGRLFIQASYILRVMMAVSRIVPGQAPYCYHCAQRGGQPPRRLQFTDKPQEPAALDTKSVTEKEFFAAIDRITNEIRRRFEQPGMEQLIGLERIFRRRC
ncbi:hypothetical protein HPB48_026448 [Haemaphysalis longicornis]|uniref:Uncharacterized protein n=1 Tax=Haemaphysalis longicornis TaxID=44386 RepID=A0A9J6HBX7_HAELO|nr:hypothetical protein HPB48_026448 [Haemaphysalis longicornis]